MKDPVSRYLTLSGDHAGKAAGLRWSRRDFALEWGDGTTFVFQEEVASFLEGFASHRPLVNFGFVVQWLAFLRPPPPEMYVVRPELHILADAYRAGGFALRNAGVLAAVLCADMPRVPETIDLSEICIRLRDPVGRSPSDPMARAQWQMDPEGQGADSQALGPPLSPEQFQDRMVRVLAPFTLDELTHWIRFGRGPMKAAKDIARHLEPTRSRALGERLAQLLEKPRLAGARRLVGPLESVLTLPRRRLVSQQLPIGGYDDVCTRGQPDQILPSQFVLEDTEFIRRFAEGELLYFRREESRHAVRETLIVLVDQGVRTWGDVRIGLAAAALAIGKSASKRYKTFLIGGTTFEGRLLDPMKVAEDELAALAEASDLSTDPGAALAAVLSEQAAGMRDIVLLTHARNLAEPAVHAAACRIIAPDRLFAVTLDDTGAGELSEVRHGEPVRLAQFHVDLEPEKAPTRLAAGKALTELAVQPPWRGQVEPMPFPFQIGTNGPIVDFDCDYSQEWLLTVSGDNLLHAWKLDGSRMEMLPRPMLDAADLRVAKDGHGAALSTLPRILSVVGVAGGFVVAGMHKAGAMIAHYNLLDRICRVLFLQDAKLPVTPVYDAEKDCVSLHDISTKHPQVVDLTNWQVIPRHRSALLAELSMPDSTRPISLGRHLPLQPTLTACDHCDKPCIFFDDEKGAIHLRNLCPPLKEPLVPLISGTPALRGSQIRDAQLRGNTLAMVFSSAAGDQLWLYRVPEGIFLRAQHLYAQESAISLSADGRRVAYKAGVQRVHVLDVVLGGRPIFSTRQAINRHSVWPLLSKSSSLLLASEGYTHLIAWHEQKLIWRLISQRRQATSPLAERPLTLPPLTAAQKLPAGFAKLRYDWLRFRDFYFLCSFLVAVDTFGQVCVFDLDENLVCIFYIRESQFAAWLPDGTVLGPPELTGSTPTPSAAEHIGAALFQAEMQG
jgi:hypothetical protein